MKFRLMAGCRQMAGDKDDYAKYLRVTRAAHFVGYCLALGLIVDSTQEFVQWDTPFNKSPIRILFFFALSLMLTLSWGDDETILKPLPPAHRMLLPIALLWLGAEAAPHFTERNLDELVGWWRASLLIALAASALLLGTERKIQRLRTTTKQPETVPAMATRILDSSDLDSNDHG